MIDIGSVLLFVGSLVLICDNKHWQYGSGLIAVGVILMILGKYVMKEKDDESD